MKKLLFLLFLSTNVLFANKYAVIIAVGDYSAKTGWSPISSANDVPLIKSTLLNQGFAESDILILQDGQATKQNILGTLKDLNERVSPGDIVVIHYSGHGQQIFDDNSEEIDGLDEALVPYDAWVEYTHNYKGENHIRDDEIGNLLANFRNNLGSDGQLLMLLDSCHSGSSTRGGKARGSAAAFVPENWEGPSKETKQGSDMFETVEISNDAAPFVLISGASANELNYEYEGQGSLSYSFAKAMSELGSDFTYRQLYSKIASVMNVISPNQTPTIEGDQDRKLFKNDYVKQQKYYEVVDVPRQDVIKMRGGKLHGIFPGTTVWVLQAGTEKVTEDKILSSGEVVIAKFNEANIKLDTPLEGTNEKNYWVFVDEKTYGEINLNVFLDKNVDKNVEKELGGFLKKNNLGRVVKDSLQSDIFITESNGNYELNTTNGFLEFAEEDKNRGTTAMESLQQKLFNFAQGQYLKNLNMNNKDYEFTFSLLPVKYDVLTEKIGDTLSPQEFVDENGVFVVHPEKDYVLLEVTNNSDKDLYVSIIEIYSNGDILNFMPRDGENCNLSDGDRKVPAHKTIVFNCVYGFAPPYEKLMLKAFASPSAINFKSTVDSRGKAGTRSATNPLEKFIGQTYNKSRGSSGTSSSGKIDGYSTEMVYEIVKDSQ